MPSRSIHIGVNGKIISTFSLPIYLWWSLSCFHVLATVNNALYLGILWLVSDPLHVALAATALFQNQAVGAFSLAKRWDGFEDRGKHKCKAHCPQPKWNAPSAVLSQWLEVGGS